MDTGSSSSSTSTPNDKPTGVATSASSKALMEYNERTIVRLDSSREKIYGYIDKRRVLSGPEEWKEINTIQTNSMRELHLEYLPYTKGFLGDFNLNSALGEERTTSERRAAGSTAGQTENLKVKLPVTAKAKNQKNMTLDKEKDAYHKEHFNYKLTPINFKENDSKICWLCSKPLIVNHHTGTPQSEHKPPCFSMALTGVGLGATNRGFQMDSGSKGAYGKTYQNTEFIEDTLKTVPGGEVNTPKSVVTDDYKLYQNWKLLVRAESMAWSHPWCNNKKSQTPFLSLRYSTLLDGSTVFMYVIEMAAITTYLQELAESDTTQRTNMNYPNGSLPEDYDVDFFGSDSVDAESNRKKWHKNALRNIVVGLIPLWCLLNQGFDIYKPVQTYCQELLSHPDGSVRTFSSILNTNPVCSIKSRIKQNCARMVARQAAKEGSLVDRIYKSVGGELNALVTELLDSFYGVGVISQSSSSSSPPAPSDVQNILGFADQPDVEDTVKQIIIESRESAESARDFLEPKKSSSKTLFKPQISFLQRRKKKVKRERDRRSAESESKSSNGRPTKKGGRRVTKRKKRKKKKTKHQRKNKKKTKRRRKRKKTRRRR